MTLSRTFDSNLELCPEREVVETGDHFINSVSLKSQMDCENFQTKKSLTIKKGFIMFLFLLLCNFVYAQNDNFYEREYSTYDAAFESLKSYSKSKGFKAVVNKYKDCKNLDGATIKSIEEVMNEFAGRMEVSITWEYKYLGCYLGIHKYNATARIKSSISKTEKGNFKISERGVDVLTWDPEK